jgi:hypothetical protein
MPLDSMVSPSAATSTAPTAIARRENLRFMMEPSAPKPNISGTVPRLNTSIDSAPFAGSPVDSA